MTCFAQVRHTLAAKLEGFPVLGLGGHLQSQFGAFNCRYRSLAAKYSHGKRHIDGNKKIVIFALEPGVG